MHVCIYGPIAILALSWERTKPGFFYKDLTVPEYECTHCPVWVGALSWPVCKSTQEAMSSTEKASYFIITEELRSSQAHITVNQIHRP